ncbi:adenylate/guanylate cyclase domain-containing protein [Microvirga tunisiensis]|uniref:Adenylate cyclase n=1 Tax=Microvirga tunisiensis TaxID=2108360 RepID=A0A5N7MSB6_9HYPH|nr:adenylate/guanylate cyclase domain-containing protein [Microvirga tunisiensis]MPR11550.1 adenylate cyclase [Microvirga tunisiensis]MPR29550.1 adenylate cyclase [Microvirga tunisiensis]
MDRQQHKVERRLAAIFAADVAGYSRLMNEDEVGTLNILTAHREVMDRQIAEHGGRIANTAGDSVLAEFPSAVDAVQCAIAVQAALAQANLDIPDERRVRFRLGVHVGDVMVRNGDLLGDGVNIAARLQSLADPGGICLSEAAYGYVRKSIPLTFNDLGEQHVKNMEEAIRAFAIGLQSNASTAPRTAPEPSASRLPEKPSIAVLPFANMSGDPEQEYFADGVVDDIITGLSQVKWFFVIARNSSFIYKGRAVDVKQVGRELGVRYVLEGSIRRAGDRIRITGQLIDAGTGAHLWANRFDGSMDNIFAFQDQITANVIGAIEPSLRRAEIERARRKRPNSLDAYDFYLRALPYAYANTPQDSEEALRLLLQALDREPDYPTAQAHAAWCYEQRFFRGGHRAKDKAEAVRHARAVMASATDDALALAIAAFVVAMLTHDYESAIGTVDRALLLNGNSALTLGFSAMTEANAGRYEAAIEHGRRAIHLSPLDPMNYHPYLGMGFAYLFSGRNEEAVVASNHAIQANPSFMVSHALLVASYAQLGHLDAAKVAAQRLLEAAPSFTVTMMEQMEFTAPERVAQFGAALRQAGLPD